MPLHGLVPTPPQPRNKFSLGVWGGVVGALGPLNLPMGWGQFCWGGCKIVPTQPVVVATTPPQAVAATPLLPAALGVGRPTALGCGQLHAAPKCPTLPHLGLGPCKGMSGQLDLGGMHAQQCRVGQLPWGAATPHPPFAPIGSPLSQYSGGHATHCHGAAAAHQGATGQFAN